MAETTPTQRDRHLQNIAEHGRMGWQKSSGYTRRALVETAISRLKRVIGDALRSRTDERRATEAAIAISLEPDARVWMPEVRPNRLNLGYGCIQCAHSPILAQQSLGVPTKGPGRFQKRGDPEQHSSHPRHALRGRAGMNGRPALRNLTHTIPRERRGRREQNRVLSLGNYTQNPARGRAKRGSVCDGARRMFTNDGREHQAELRAPPRPAGIDNLQPPALPLIRIRGILGVKLIDGV